MKWSTFLCIFRGWGLSVPGLCCENAIALCLPEALLCTGGCCIAPSRPSSPLSVSTPGDLPAISISWDSLSPLSLHNVNVPRPRQIDMRRPLHRLDLILSQRFTGGDGIWCWRGHLVSGPPLLPEHPPCLRSKRHMFDLFSRLHEGWHQYKLGRIVRMSGQDTLKIYHLLQNKYQRFPLTSHPQDSALQMAHLGSEADQKTAYKHPVIVLVNPTFT